MVNQDITLIKIWYAYGIYIHVGTPELKSTSVAFPSCFFFFFFVCVFVVVFFLLVFFF